jgi:hypothetical protein
MCIMQGRFQLLRGVLRSSPNCDHHQLSEFPVMAEVVEKGTAEAIFGIRL